MKQLRIVLLFLMVATLFPAALFAQEATPTDSIDMLEALAIVREAYGAETSILAATLDAENACWQFELADVTTACVDETTGNILTDGDADTGAVDNVEDGAVDDSDDAEVDNVEDGAIADVEDGAVDDSDDAEVDNVEDDAVDDSNDGAVDDSDDEQETPIVTVEEAVVTALALFPDSAVTSISFQMLDDGTFTWDIGLDDVLSVDVDAATGEVVFSGDETDDQTGTPVNIEDGAVDNVDDGDMDDSDDGEVDNVDDGAVGDTNGGEVDDTDDSAADNTNDNAVDNQDNGGGNSSDNGG